MTLKLLWGADCQNFRSVFMISTFVYKKKKIRFRVRGEGQGKTIVLLHGFLESMKIWNKLEKMLAGDFKVISIDLPGFGKSECIEPVHTMSLMANVVNKILLSLEVKRCIMLGHSMGGYVALAFAAQFPSKMKGLVLFHSKARADTPEAKLNRNRAVRIIESDRSNFIFQFIPELFAPGNKEYFQEEINALRKIAAETSKDGIIAALEGMKLRRDRMHVLSDAAFPVLFIAGKEDTRIPLADIVEEAQLPGHSEIVIMSDVGHMGIIEAREKTNKIIQSFAMRVL